jgi:L-lactate dehydrogenase complex protein LldF
MSTPAEQFKHDAERLTHDLRHRSLIQTALRKYEAARDAKKSRYRDWQSARQTAAEIKWDAINHLDKYLEEFAGKIEARGAKVHWASNGEQARQIILGIIRAKEARSIIKSKVMTGEEIHLNEALEKAGLTVVESDFGEYIVQLRHEAPYHFVFPCISCAGKSASCFKRNSAQSPQTSPRNL